MKAAFARICSATSSPSFCTSAGFAKALVATEVYQVKRLLMNFAKPAMATMAVAPAQLGLGASRVA